MSVHFEKVVAGILFAVEYSSDEVAVAFGLKVVRVSRFDWFVALVIACSPFVPTGWALALVDMVLVLGEASCVMVVVELSLVLESMASSSLLAVFSVVAWFVALPVVAYHCSAVMFASCSVLSLVLLFVAWHPFGVVVFLSCSFFLSLVVANSSAVDLSISSFVHPLALKDISVLL